jgi:uncharacterized protein involved in exopolysaccharide biosynthesis
MDEMRTEPVDYLAILKRRMWSVILPALIIFAAAVAAALTLPAVYRSTASILIEAREVPQDFIVTTNAT